MDNLKKVDDEELIAKIKNGELDYYELIVRRYNPYLYKIGRTYGFNHTDTEDLMQETYINTYKGLAKFEYKAKFKTWITRIMLNNCYHKKNKTGYMKEIDKEPREDSNLLFSNTSRNTEEVVRSHELRHIIEEALNNIPFNYRMVFTLREMNGMNTAETAELLGISEANVKVRFNRAKKMLREQLEQAYSKVELFEFNLIHCDPMVERVMKEVKLLESDD